MAYACFYIFHRQINLKWSQGDELFRFLFSYCTHIFLKTDSPLKNMYYIF